MEVRESLEADIQEELGHARKLADRLKVLDAPIPGSLGLKFNQKKLQPPKNTTDVKSVILGVIAAEEEAIEHYGKLIQLTDGVDYVTQDLAITLKGDEEMHRREFLGFLRDFEARPSLKKK
jgi:bacterioferritin